MEIEQDLYFTSGKLGLIPACPSSRALTKYMCLAAVNAQVLEDLVKAKYRIHFI